MLARNLPVEVLFWIDDDMPRSVVSVIANVNIVGINEYMEKDKDAEIVKKLEFSKCHLSLAIPKDADYDGLKWFEGKKIATSDPKILNDFLDKNGIKSDIHVITGSVEIAPGIGLSDAIFDIVSSGSTLVSNQLKEVEVVVESQAVMIANKSLTDEKREILEELLFRVDAVLAADGKKYILMNVPNASLDTVLEILPGIKSPTVMPIAQEGWSSVHAVLPEKRFWEIINRLRSAGAEGILVLNIEKMVL